jgi:hypothetical protein
MASRKPRTWFPKITGGVHFRIWFAKAGRGTPNDTGIAPVPARHIENGTYSFSLALFDPTDMTQKEATEAGKESSMYKGMGAQFGAQIWRMAHEAEVGDFIFLESENHHLHAVGVISGEYSPPKADSYTEEELNQSGAHSIPVKWLPIKDGKDFIQLGRLDNATFRDVAEKDELASLLIFSTAKIVAEALDISHEEWAGRICDALRSAAPNDTTESLGPTVTYLKAADSPDLKDDFSKFVYEALIAASEIETFNMCGGIPDLEAAESSPAKEVVPEPASVAPEPKAVEVPKVITHVARNGVYIHQAIEETVLHQLISSKTVVLTDHVYHPISINWMTIEEYLKIRGLNI